MLTYVSFYMRRIATVYKIHPMCSVSQKQRSVTPLHPYQKSVTHISRQTNRTVFKQSVSVPLVRMATSVSFRRSDVRSSPARRGTCTPLRLHPSPLRLRRAPLRLDRPQLRLHCLFASHGVLGSSIALLFASCFCLYPI